MIGIPVHESQKSLQILLPLESMLRNVHYQDLKLDPWQPVAAQLFLKHPWLQAYWVGWCKRYRVDLCIAALAFYWIVLVRKCYLSM